MSLHACLTYLDEAIAAAGELGIDTAAAAAVGETARDRLGYPVETYVLAIAGGTGVGKSTILNALAEAEVSAASVRRPTTTEPVAWVPADRRRELSGLLTWLGVTQVREHQSPRLRDLAILDLPDFDSVALDHRERVDALLARIDAVAWVVDPEKYKDDIVHRDYLRRVGPRVRRQLVVLNRADLLDQAESSRVVEDLRQQLRRDDLADVAVAVTRAKQGAAGVTELREWLDSGIEAKRVITSRLAADAHETMRALAIRAGVAEGRIRPLIDPARTERAIDAVGRRVLALVDIAGLGRQAVAATRQAARPRGAGPLGHLTSAIYRLAGRARASADPRAYLRSWQRRGSLAPAVEPLRDLITTTLATVPGSIRGPLAALSATAHLERRLAETVDDALESEAAAFTVPTSPLWSIIGAAQFVVTGILLFCGLWFVSLFVIGGVPVGSVELPYLGPLPTPVALLAATLLFGYLLAVSLRMHAGWLGRRWARRLGARITDSVRARIAESLLLPVERFDAARERLAAVARAAQDECAPL